MQPKLTTPHFGRYLLLVFCISIIFFFFSTLITMRILNRVMVAEVPDITGKSVEAARGILRLKRLSLDITEFRFDTHVALNQIITQDPKPGQTVKNGRMVSVIVSRGVQTTKLPSLLGLSIHEASEQLSNKNLLIGQVTQWHTSTSIKNSILDQWPLAEQYIAQNSKIDLLISAGPHALRWIMPNFKGMPFNKVTTLIKFMGLNLQALKRINNNHYPANTVVEQKPVSGEQIESDQVVSLLITQKSDVTDNPGRYVAIRFKLPVLKSTARLKMVLEDDFGVREIYNAMERPKTEITVPATVHGAKASVTIMLNGQVMEVRSL